MKTYYVRFGSGDPRSNSGLAPTFLSFNNYGSAVTPPGITSVIGATGFYAFQYGTTTPIVFLIDGATSGLDSSSRYVAGSIDPADRSDEYGNTLISYSQNIQATGLTTLFGVIDVEVTQGFIFAQGTSITSQGVSNAAQNVTITSVVNTLASGTSQTAELLLRIGSTLSVFGTSAVDPTDVFGYLKRMQEFNEGNQSFVKTSGAWAISSRGGTLLATKSLSNSSTTVTKS